MWYQREGRHENLSTLHCADMGNKFGSLSLLCPTPTSQRRYHETANRIWKYLPLYIMHIFNNNNDDDDDNLENRFLHLCKSSFPCWRLTRLFSSTLGMKQGQTKSTKSLKIGTKVIRSVSILASTFVLLGSVKTHVVALSQVDWDSPDSIRKFMIVLTICILWFLCDTLKKGNPFGPSWKTWANSDKFDFSFTRFFCHIKILKLSLCKFFANWSSFEVYRLFLSISQRNHKIQLHKITLYKCTSWTHFSFCHGELVHHQCRPSAVQLCAENVLSSRWYIRRGICEIFNTSKIPNCHTQIPGDSAWLSWSACNQLVS